MVDDLSYVDEAAAVESSLDEIIPIHAEDNAESSYDMDTYREDSYIEDVPSDDSYIDDFDTGDSYIENEPYSETYPEVDYEIDAGDIIPMSDGYYMDDFSANNQTAGDNFEGIDEIIPIHAENRRRERTSPNVSAGFQFNSFNDNPQVIDEEPNIVDVSNMPEGSAPVQTLIDLTVCRASSVARSISQMPWYRPSARRVRPSKSSRGALAGRPVATGRPSRIS